MPTPPNDRLDGWKAIADYLARHERTVQRWHHERAMPVHHVPGKTRGVVFAYRSELDAWLRDGGAASENIENEAVGLDPDRHPAPDGLVRASEHGGTGDAAEPGPPEVRGHGKTRRSADPVAAGSSVSTHARAGPSVPGRRRPRPQADRSIPAFDGGDTSVLQGDETLVPGLAAAREAGSGRPPTGATTNVVGLHASGPLSASTRREFVSPRQVQDTQETGPATPAIPAPRYRHPRGWRALARQGAWAIPAGALLAVAGIAALVPRMSPEATGPIERLELNRDRLVAIDRHGRELWSRALPSASAEGAVGPFQASGDTALVDLDLDGVRELIVFLTYRQVTANPRSEFAGVRILCLSAEGRLLWTYVPDSVFSFAGRRFGGPWRLGTWLASAGPTPEVWVSFVDHTWWPSFIVRLGAVGDARVAFVNAGHLTAISHLRIAGRTYVLAGGVNNEFRSAALAVLETDALPASSPQSAGSPFACDSCPTGRPLRYLLFPGAEVGAALGEAYNFVDAASVPGADGSVEVSVKEVSDPFLRSVYRLSRSLTPESVAMSDRYWEVHRDLFQAGKLNHPPESCPERLQGMAVRMWERDTGWKDVPIPPTFARGSPPLR